MSIRCRPVSVALLGLFLWTTACSSYSQIEPGEVADHDHVRVIMTDGVQYDLYDPVIEADSIRGREVREEAPDYPYPIQSIPLDQISAIETTHVDAAETALVVVGVTFVGLTILAVATADLSGLGGMQGCCGDGLFPTSP